MADLQVDASINGLTKGVGETAERADEVGFDCLWNPETEHDSFAPLPVVADRTEDIEFGTRIATAFTRSPMVLAQQAWDLQAYSDGRFILGLGTQVRAHNERRFSVDFEWESPGPRLREVIESLRHIWEAFQENRESLDYEGEFYDFSLLTDTFNPGPIDDPDIPIYTAAVNEYNIRMAGEICDGIALHSFNTPSYTREVVAPKLQQGADRAGRSVDEVSVSASPFVVTGRDEEERERQRQEVRQRVAFYASTPTYKDVMAHHGWVDTGRELHELSKEGKWQEMAGLVTDEMMDAFAVEAHPDELADALVETYGDLADRVSLALDLENPELAEQVLDRF
jgi:probable F420-dependent oxidoreductase